ncbi:MAG: GMP reductase [Cytophagia bacterium]|jgi:GMP reductase|nr:GMP reductase [Cytophagia bacterium]
MTANYNEYTYALGYKDVYLVPNYSELESRANADTSVKIKDFRFSLPIMPSNMKSVVDLKTYHLYDSLGLAPIMHRFDLSNYKILNSISTNWRAISVGVKQEDREELRKCTSLSLLPTCICIDIAHGHSLAMKNMIKFVRETFPDVIIVAGNVTTGQACKDLAEWGADLVKVGIGPGQVCSTKNKTGFHMPMFTAVKSCAEVSPVPIVADGGFRENGDIAKALVAGATFCMIGGMFAACSDSPATMVNGKKEYYGSASERNKGSVRNIEGFTTHLTPTNTITSKIREIQEDLQSAISYAGGKDLSALDLSKVEYRIVYN